MTGPKYQVHRAQVPGPPATTPLYPARPATAPAYPQPATARAATAGRGEGPARAVGPRLHIDWTACDGRGACTELLPELLGRDEWGYPVPRDGSRDPVVPDGLAKHAQRAVDACPVLALRLLSRR